MELVKVKADTVDDAVKQINKARLNHKDEWFTLYVDLGDNNWGYRFKIYNTVTQIAEGPDFRSGGAWGLNVTEWKAELKGFMTHLG